MEKINFLADYLNCNVEEIEEQKIENYFKHDDCEYLVVTHEEAHDIAKNNVEETLYSYYPNVLAEATGLDEIIFKTFNKTGLCESLNEPIKHLLEGTCGFSQFAENMIEEEGLNYYITHGDGEEYVEGEYRIYEMGY